MKIDSKIRRELFDIIVSKDNFLGKYNGIDGYNDVTIVDFLKLIWDLASMPSEDPRFRNAEADAYQHLINNDDWDINHAFLVRFNLLRDADEIFMKFLEAIVSPDVRENNEDIQDYVNLINPLLSKSNHKLYIVDYINNATVYRVKEGLSHTDFFIDKSNNSYPIYVDEDPRSFPSLLLKERRWDDYGYKTTYELSFYESNEDFSIIGRVKILNGEENTTYGSLPSGQTSFDNKVCSLGQDIWYYRELKKKLGSKYKSVLLALRDAAFFTKICDDFKDHRVFKISLLRDSSADKALNTARYVLAGYNENENFDFIFKALLPYYPSNSLNIRFNFGQINSETNINRIIALIGDNGVGKTTILKQMAESLVMDNAKNFLPHEPVFSKVIAVSFSIFDRFYEIKCPSHFNYVYCGFHKKNAELLSEEEISERRKEALCLLGRMSRVKIFNKFMRDVIDEQLLDEIWEETEWRLIDTKYSELCSKLSSGQSLLFHMAAEIIANIRENTLILVDEPEVHLHPKAITQIMNMFNHICEKYSSCCVMATHSPIVIQNLLSKNVVIISKEEDGEPVARRMRIESLGDNLASITEDIFGRYATIPFYM